MPIKSGVFVKWLKGNFYKSKGKALSTDVVERVSGLLEAMAIDSGEKHDLSVRVARRGDVIYYDLGDAVVSVDKNGWTEISDPPVVFRWHVGMKNQVHPVRGQY